MGLKLRIFSLATESEQHNTEDITFDKDEISVGRHATNDVVLPQAEISSSHARFYVDQTNGSAPSVYVVDVGSKNGTFIGNKRLPVQSPQVLQDRQRVLIGNFLIRAVYEDVTASSTYTEEEARTIITQETTAESKDAVASEPCADLPPDDELLKLLAQAPVEHFYEVADEDTGQILAAESSASPLSVEDIAAKKQEPVANDLVKTASEPLTPCSTSAASGEKVTVQHSFSAIRLFPVKGRVLLKGQGLADVELTCSFGTSKTDIDGNFLFADIEEDTPFEIRPQKEGFIFRPELLAGQSTEQLELNFTAVPLITVQGVIMYHGQALDGVEIDGGPLGKTVSGADGSYCFHNVPEGTEYSITPSKPGYRFAPQK